LITLLKRYSLREYPQNDCGSISNVTAVMRKEKYRQQKEKTTEL